MSAAGPPSTRAGANRPGRHTVLGTIAGARVVSAAVFASDMRIGPTAGTGTDLPGAGTTASTE